MGPAIQTRKLESSPLHICFICNELPPAPAGGIGTNVLTNAKHLVRAGHRVTIIGNYERDFHWDIPGVSVIPLPLRYSGLSLFGRIRGVIQERIQLRQAIRRVHAQVALDIVEWPDCTGLFLRSIPGITDVVRNHGPLMSHRLFGLLKRSRVSEWLELHTLRTIPNWIGVSQWFMKEWLCIAGARPRNIVVINNMVDCELFHPEGGETRSDLILYSGSLYQRKGVFALARAARLFLKELPYAKLRFVGRDANGARQRILDLAGSEVAGQIEFHEPISQSDLALLMRSATVFAMPSLLESFGNVWAEAMASGVPVVGSKLTCGPEIVPDGEAGLLVNPVDAQETASAIVRLMKDPSLRRTLGRRGRSLACERYSSSALTLRTIDFYRQCIESTP